MVELNKTGRSFLVIIYTICIQILPYVPIDEYFEIIIRVRFGVREFQLG